MPVRKKKPPLKKKKPAAARKKRTRAGPSFYTWTIPREEGCVMVLTPRGGRPCAYRLEGWMELAVLEAAGSKRLSGDLRVVNLRGTLLDGGDERAPQRFHLALANGERPTLSLPSKGGSGELKTSFALTYDGLALHRKHRSSPCAGHFDAIRPLPAEIRLGWQYDAKRKRLGLHGIGTFTEFPGLSAELVPWSLYWWCVPDGGLRCLELCLSIKMAAPQGLALHEQTTIERFVAETNGILDCDGGQCCIRLRVAELIAQFVPPLPDVVNGGNFRQVVQTSRSTECYNIYFVEEVGRIQGGDAKGGTAYGDNAGSVVEAPLPEFEDVGLTLAHEIGHALGLANGRSDDPDGLTGHSTFSSNLMFGGGGTPGKKVSEPQCLKMRSSPLLTQTAKACDLDPQFGQVF